MRYRSITREEFVAVACDPQLDKFAGTFRAKADLMGLWPHAFGAVTHLGQVRAAICVTIAKRRPFVANLQLLHTFARWRRLGFARELTLREYRRVLDDGAEYFRVSSEPEAAPFYRALGFRFWGEQKSGCLLSIHRVVSPFPGDGAYVLDEIIDKAINSGRKGCVVRPYEKPC